MILGAHKQLWKKYGGSAKGSGRVGEGFRRAPGRSRSARGMSTWIAPVRQITHIITGSGFRFEVCGLRFEGAVNRIDLARSVSKARRILGMLS